MQINLRHIFWIILNESVNIMCVFRHKKLCVPILLIASKKVSTSNVVKAGFDIEKRSSRRRDLFLMSNPAFMTLLVDTFFENHSKLRTHNFLCRKTRIIFNSNSKLFSTYALNLFARIIALPDQIEYIVAKWLFQE